MNGLLKEKLRKLGQNSYQHWRDNLHTALQQLNNRPLGDTTPLGRMLTPNLQIRRTSEQSLQWWAIDKRSQSPLLGTLESAGNHLRSLEVVDIPPGWIVTVPTGLGIKIPTGHFGWITPRSSLVVKGLQIMAGIIDEASVGEIRVLLHNVASEATTHNAQDRIAQLIIVLYQKGQCHHLDAPPPVTTRTGGFGSTELKIGVKVWVKRTSTAAPPKAEVVAKGSNTFALMLPGQEKIEILPSNQMFIWE